MAINNSHPVTRLIASMGHKTKAPSRHERFLAALAKLKRKTSVKDFDSNWEPHELLCQSGQFFLGDVCDVIKMKAGEVQRLSKSNPDMGVFFDARRKSWIVDMESFSLWLRSNWVVV